MRNFWILILVLSLLSSCNGQVSKSSKTENMNKLVHSSSPYLLQHASNPVHWQEWGEEALSMAKEQNKPLIISIGYAACHWCHVMEHESFSDEEVAAFMNEHFICIKVDREERPDIDQIYMDAVHLINGQGGWPLNAFAMPDGRPFFAGTYFNKQRWMAVMKQISDLYKNEYNKVEEYANELTTGINKNPLPVIDEVKDIEFTSNEYEDLLDQWLAQFDSELGGFSRAPKFPLPSAWEFLLQYHYFTEDKQSLAAVEVTLDEMAKGGIYDQIGGGFARYSVDAEWKVPHFEKMLYDNAQLVSLYSHAYQITRKPRFKEIVIETLEFIEREMMDVDGGCYSSLNADSENVEGKFYVWTYDEFITTVDKENQSFLIDYYQITEAGNWEDGINILLPVSSKEEFVHDNNLDTELFKSALTKANHDLFETRKIRERPSTDDKVLTSWNGLMIQGYVDAYKALGEKRYLQQALSIAKFIEEHMLNDDGSLSRNYRKGNTSISGFHDDYAIFADACIDIYSVTYDKHWLELSQGLADYCIDHFYNDESGMFYYTSDNNEALVARKYELSDNVIPSSNSIMAGVLFKLSHYFDNQQYYDIVLKMVGQEIDNIRNSGIWHSNWAAILGLIINGITEVAIMGKDALSQNVEMQKSYLPASLFMGGLVENLPLLLNKYIDGRTMIYVCRNKTCNLPTEDSDEALAQIRTYRNLNQ